VTAWMADHWGKQEQKALFPVHARLDLTYNDLLSIPDTPQQGHRSTHNDCVT
jgi:hypothetical protein